MRPIRAADDRGGQALRHAKRRRSFALEGYGKPARQGCGLRRNRCRLSCRFELWTMISPPVSVSTPQAKTETIMTINEAKGMSNENSANPDCPPKAVSADDIAAGGGEIGKRLIGIGNARNPCVKPEKSGHGFGFPLPSRQHDGCEICRRERLFRHSKGLPLCRAWPKPRGGLGAVQCFLDSLNRPISLL